MKYFYILFDYIRKNYLYIIIILLLLTILAILIFIFLLFTIFKCYECVKHTLHNNVSNYSDFDVKSKNILNIYKDYKIKHVYLSKEIIISRFIPTKYVLKIIKLFYNNDDDYYSFEAIKNNCFHTSLILFLINDKNKKKKFIKLDKCRKLKIVNNITINNEDDILFFDVKKNITFNDMLKKTKKRCGKDKFYNWDIKNNNCNDIVSDFLSVLGIKEKIDILEWTRNNYNNDGYSDLSLFIFKNFYKVDLFLYNLMNKFTKYLKENYFIKQYSAL